MKSSLVWVMVALAASLIIFATRSSTDRIDQADRTDRFGQARKPRPAPDFWTSARDPYPGHDLPVTVIRPASLGVFPPAAPVDHPARIVRAISENDHSAIQSATLAWFEQDPAAARDWLAMQPTYDDLQPAISYIASKISEDGDLTTALEWTKLLPEGTLRDDTIFDIHALALRNGRITALEIPLDGIPPDRREELLGGAAGD